MLYEWLQETRALVALAMVVAALSISGCNDDDDNVAAESRFALTLLHSNDGESKLISSDDFGGVDRFVALMKHLKTEATEQDSSDMVRGVLSVTSGDNFLAGPQFNASLEDGVPYYDAIALDLAGFDAMCLGNHDFDFGPEVLQQFIVSFDDPVPFLSANLDFSDEQGLQNLVNTGRIARYTVVSTGGEQIGVVGATTELLPFISSPRNVVVNEVAAAVQLAVDELLSQGINKIVLISHLQSVNEEIALTGLLSGVDIIVAGGGDEVLADENTLLIPGDEALISGSYPLLVLDADDREVPVVTTPGEYRYIGRLMIEFDLDGEIAEIDDASGLVRVAGGDHADAIEPDALATALVTEPIEAAVAELAANVAAVSEVTLDGVRANVRTRETNEGNLIADSLLWQATQLAASFGAPAPDVALQNSGGIRNNNEIAPGNVTELHTFDMVPFSNFVSIVPDISREQFKEILENAVSNVENSDGRFAQIAGFSLTWDAAQTAQTLDENGEIVTAGARVREIALDDGTVIVTGGAVVAGDTLTVATIDFLARGGDQYPYRGAAFTSVGVSYQRALRDYIVNALGGNIRVADYPEGGEGRITRQN